MNIKEDTGSAKFKTSGHYLENALEFWKTAKQVFYKRDCHLLRLKKWPS